MKVPHMRVMVFGKATKDTEAGVMPTAEIWEAMEQFNEELAKAGIVAMKAAFAKIKEIQDHNEQWTCSDPFWGPPYPLAPITPPPSAAEIRGWEAEHNLRLPAALTRALQTQNGGSVRGADVVLCPLAKFQLLSEPRWDQVFRCDQIVTERDKLLYIGFEDQVPAIIILNYSQRREPSVLYLWKDLGDELREEADTFDALIKRR